jgi:hypothetical protein
MLMPSFQYLMSDLNIIFSNSSEAEAKVEVQVEVQHASLTIR